MRLLSRAAFYHRHDEDDSWDSICMKCFLTVGTAAKEEDLQDAEEHHDDDCDEFVRGPA